MLYFLHSETMSMEGGKQSIFLPCHIFTREIGRRSVASKGFISHTCLHAYIMSTIYGTPYRTQPYTPPSLPRASLSV